MNKKGCDSIHTHSSYSIAPLDKDHRETACYKKKFGLLININRYWNMMNTRNHSHHVPLSINDKAMWALLSEQGKCIEQRERETKQLKGRVKDKNEVNGPI